MTNSEIIRKITEEAPCHFCKYSGPNYFQAGTHRKTCPWYKIGGLEERKQALPDLVLAISADRISELEEEVKKWIKYHDAVQLAYKEKRKDANDLFKQLAKAENLLKERDGGGHDADCKIYKGRGSIVYKCNCGHQDVLDYFKNKQD